MSELDLERTSREDGARSRDRSRVWHARRTGRRRVLAWLLFGPGILAMLGENDGPSMVSYAADGATYGLGFFLPFIVVLFAMAYVVQEMSMRIGAVTHRGYGELVLRRFGKLWGWFSAGDLLITNLVTLVSEFVAIRVGLAYFHLGAGVAAVLGVALVIFAAQGGRYWRWERVVLGLSVFNGLFLVCAFLVTPDPGSLTMAFLTWSPLPTGDFTTLLLLITATIGATVTPWMIFFQQSASVDKGMTSSDINHGRFDTALGAALAALFGCGALVTGAVLIHQNGSAIQGLAGAGFPSALAATSGNLVGTLFALGLIEAGAVAILTISASTGYAIGECLGAPSSFNGTARTSRLFFSVNVCSAVAAGGVIVIPGVPLLAIALNANVLATVLLPVTLIFMVMLANDRVLMGDRVNSRLTNIAAIGITVFIGLCGSGYAVISFLQAVHVIPPAG